MTTVKLAAALDDRKELPGIQAVIDKQSHRLTLLTLSPKQKDFSRQRQPWPDMTDSLSVQLPCGQLLQLSNLYLHSFVP
jgi:hypothetical protein